jgi:hypothetical protein
MEKMSSKRRLEKLAKHIACDVTSKILCNAPQNVDINEITELVYNHLQNQLHQLHFEVNHRSHSAARLDEIKHYEKRDVSYELAMAIEKAGLLNDEELTRRDKITTSKYSIIVLKKD